MNDVYFSSAQLGNFGPTIGAIHNWSLAMFWTAFVAQEAVTSLVVIRGLQKKEKRKMDDEEELTTDRQIDTQTEKEQGRIHGYPSRVRVGRSYI